GAASAAVSILIGISKLTPRSRFGARADQNKAARQPYRLPRLCRPTCELSPQLHRPAGPRRSWWLGCAIPSAVLLDFRFALVRKDVPAVSPLYFQPDRP